MRASDVHQTLQEGSGGQDDRLCFENNTHTGCNAPDFSLFDAQVDHGILPKIEVGCIFEHTAPFGRKFGLIALRSGTPHGRTFRSVQHAELQRCPVGDDSHISAHRIDLSHDLSFGHTSNGWIAGHLRKFGHVHRDQQGLASHIGCRCCRLTSCMASSDDDDIVFESHCLSTSLFFRSILFG